MLQSQATEDRDRQSGEEGPAADTALLQTALDRDGSLPTAKDYASLANGYLACGTREKARGVLRAAMTGHHRNSIILKGLGELEFQTGNHAASAELWGRLLAKKKQDAQPAVYARLAASLRHIGKREEALRAIGEGLRHHPGNARLAAEKARIERTSPPPPAPASREAAPAGRHPYKGRPAHSFWERTVSCRNPLEIDSWYRRKFPLAGCAIASGGSCFAQHLGRRLRQSGFDYLDVEPAPDFLLPESHADFGYGLYSARYGNIYTSRQLLQLVERALGRFTPLDRAWPSGEGVVDPFRPTIEPEPFASEAEMLAAQRVHLEAVVELMRRTDVFVFTLGLTECWTDSRDGAAYPIAPGVSGGRYDPGRHKLANLDYPDVVADLHGFMQLARSLNPGMRLLMTVSPVPLMATATDENVVVATTHSKSVLRAAAGSIARSHEWADYFPSFEIISSHVMRGQFYSPDMRNVSPVGVDHVMRQFFAEHPPADGVQVTPAATPNDPDGVVCDEELLGAFGE